ncbi:phosphotransferase [Nonomuraea fuscirosea]
MTVADRPTWETLPLAVRDAVEERLGTVSGVRCMVSRRPGFVGQVYAADEDALVKAVPLKCADHMEPFQRERQAASFLPWPGAPAPWLLWAREEGDWLVMAFELIDDVRYVNLRRCDPDLPIALNSVGWLSQQPCREGWENKVRSVQQCVYALRSAVDPLLDRPLATMADPHRYRRAVDLLSMDRLTAAVPTLLHGDVSRRNMLFGNSMIYMIDWSKAFVGPGWLDLACGLGPLLVAEGHKPKEAYKYLYAAAPDAWAAAHPQDVAAMVALTSLRHWSRTTVMSPAYRFYRQNAQILARASDDWLDYTLKAL